MRSIHGGSRIAQPITTVVMIVVVFIAGFALGNQYAIGSAQALFSQPSDDETQALFAPFWQAYLLIVNDYVDPEGDPLDKATLVDGAISGMVDALDDEFSGYMDPEIFPQINEELEGEIEGIGVVIRTIDETGEIAIVSVLPESPALEAGILPGDIFAFVDGEDVSAMSQMELAQRVRGPVGTTVEITMRRDDALVDFTVERARIVIPNIETDTFEDAIGYIRLNQFSPNARTEINEALDELGADTLNGLVLDLRGNPGGLLNQAIDVGSAFLPEGVLLIEDFGDNNEQTLNVTGNVIEPDLPLVVLVDETSASASELVAGALQDNGRATVIGETTFGKGTVQTWQNLINGGGIRLTIARWLTPDRSWIHNEGITPDIEVDWDPVTLDEDEDDPQLDAALEFLRSTMLAEMP